ncbi:MAG: Hsp20/alpha crystallin family protein [Spirochaetaceae bacterium]|jgi:HSP20 family protein|nr:Hsp20/alpha crystallin family protein [Spirochaetaceae bacterium]
MKAVSLYRPVSIENVMEEFDRYLEAFFGDSPQANRTYGYLPAVDIRETDGAYVLEAELPGYEEKDLEIHVDNRTLIIQSKKEEASKEKEKEAASPKGRYFIRERRKSAFTRSFKLPEDADHEAISAGFKNGLLTLEIKKRAETKKRFIQIGAK